MVDGMDGVHVVGESEGEGLGADLGDDFEWSKELLQEFLGRPRSSEELSLDERLISDLEFRRRRPTGIGGSLVLALRVFDIFFDLVMKFIGVDCKISSVGRNDVLFQMDCNVRIVPLVRKEWTNSR